MRSARRWEEIIDEMCQRGRWRHADVKGFIDVIICRADACAAIGQVDRVVGLHILIICVVHGAKVQKNNQLCKFLGRKLHKFLRIHKERGDSFEPHLFYFLDLSQEETCCVLILQNDYFRRKDEEIVSVTLFGVTLA